MTVTSIGRRVGRLLAQPERIGWQLDLLRDVISIERGPGNFLGQAVARSHPRRNALIVSRTAFVYQIKLEAMLGVALALHAGLRPVVVVPTGGGWPLRYFRAFGITDLRTLEEYLSLDERHESERIADSVLAGDVSFQKLKSFEHRGAAVGRQVLSTISRRLRRGVVRMSDPEALALIHELLPDALDSIAASERLLATVDPEIVIFNEKGYAGYGSVYDVALTQQRNVIQFLHAHRHDALVFKRYTAETRGVHGTSLSRETWERVRMEPWTAEKEAELQRVFDDKYAGRWAHPNGRMHAGKVMRPREEVLGSLGLDRTKRTAVLFSHVLWDANLFYGEDLFADQEEWFVETVRAAIANDRLNWIIKLHPANVWKLMREGDRDDYYELKVIRSRFGQLPPHVAVMMPETPISALAVFRLADYGVTIRGTIGYELPCFGVPALTAGTGRYSGFGFTIDSVTPQEYLGRLACLERLPRLDADTTTLAKKHAHAIFMRRQCPFTSFDSVFRPPEQGVHPLDHDLRVRVRSFDELEASEDLRRFARWAVDRSRLDFMVDDPQ